MFVALKRHKLIKVREFFQKFPAKILGNNIKFLELLKFLNS